MNLPRDLSGNGLAALLGRFGYLITRQTGSHMRLTSALQGSQHHVTVPQHKALREGWSLRKIAERENLSPPGVLKVLRCNNGKGSPPAEKVTESKSEQ